MILSSGLMWFAAASCCALVEPTAEKSRVKLIRVCLEIPLEVSETDIFKRFLQQIGSMI